MKKPCLAALAVFATSALNATSAAADTGVGLRVGSMGFGADFSIAMTEHLNARLAYNYLNYDRTVEDTDVTYDGTLKISSFSGFLDWHPFAGGFRLSAGAVGGGPKVDVVGTPTNGTYEIGGTTYTAAEVGSLRGQLKIGNSIAPYVGLGYGNVVSEKHRVTFLFDLGAIYGGSPDVTLTAQCGAAVPSLRCTQLQNDVADEIESLKSDASTIKWYPVINIGLGIRF